MEQIKVTSKLSAAERETILSYDCESKMWVMYSMVPKHYNKALKQGWKPIKQYVHEDGQVCGMVFEAPERAVTIRNTTKKAMSDKQMHNLLSDDYC